MVEPLFVDGEFTDGDEVVTVRAPWDDRALADVAFAGPRTLERALAAGHAAVPTMRALPAHRRRALLAAVADGIAAHADALTALIVDEAGKPFTAARAEVERAAQTFRLAAASTARHDVGLALDHAPAGEGRYALARRVPRGLAVAITPFNFPLNLVAHKVAPALAAGCPVIVKPSEQTPRTALLLARLVADAGAPRGAVQVVPASRAHAPILVEDARPRVVSFTGSAAVGWALRAAAGEKHVVLELGGDAAVVVTAGADLDDAARRTAMGAFVYAGQVCISVQRVLVEASVLDAFRARLLAHTAALVSGDPRDPHVVNGPLIDARQVARVRALVDDAVAKGGRVLCGGTADGPVVAPTILEDVPVTARLHGEEVFGPVCTLAAFTSLDEAAACVNASPFGLQCGIFCDDVGAVWRFADAVEVGGVIHDDVPTFRVDDMPYGGVKRSGTGREGLPWALDDYTDVRVLALRP